MPYDPRLSALIELTDQEWGDPTENAKNLVYYGLNYVDQALFGIDIIRGELIGIQAEAKMRKSTMLANVILNIAASKRFWLCIDTLESGMPPSAYRDVLIAITATRFMISEFFGDDRRQWPSYEEMLQHPELGPSLRISKEFLWYKSRNEFQQNCIIAAKKYLSTLPIMIFGPSPSQGDARDLPKSIDRWDRLYNGKYKGCGVQIFACDHIQQIGGYDGSDYAKMEAVVGAYAGFITTHVGTCIFAVSQLGVGSVRMERQGIARGMAKGGAKLEAECNVLFRTRYTTDQPQYVSISLDATRRSPPPPIRQELEPNSGAFLRPAKLA